MITIICGTNRKNSNSEIISGIYKEKLENEGQACQLINLKDLPADFIATALYEESGKNEFFNPTREMMLHSDKYIFVVPEYNGSFPGILKTFIDGLIFPDTLRGKKCAMVGLSSGIQGSVLAMSHLTDILNYCGTLVIPQKPKLHGIEKNLSEGQINNPLYLQLIDEQIQALIAS